MNSSPSMTAAGVPHVPLEEAARLVGTELFVSDWKVISPHLIELFQTSTELRGADTDLTVCKANPMPEIVDGFWLLSMLVPIHFDYSPIRSPGMWGLNYGAESLRFLTPVMTGQRIRFRATLDELRPHPRGTLLVTTNTCEVEGSERPAMVARHLTLAIVGELPA